jgi:hypothetical protein
MKLLQLVSVWEKVLLTSIDAFLDTHGTIIKVLPLVAHGYQLSTPVGCAWGYVIQ